MRFRIWSAAFGALSLVVTSCSENDITGPTRPDSPHFISTSSLPSIRISEFHYDNASTDAGEAIEVSGPAGTDLTGYSIVLYNGSNGLSYDTDALPTPIPATCGTRGVVVLNYAVNGIQNGNPDGIALVGPGSTVIEFISYGGAMTALNGPANGMTSTNIPVSEGSTTLVGHSLKRDGAGVWSGPSANNFGTCNDEDLPPAVVDHVVVTPETGTVIEGATQQFTGVAYDASNNPIPGETLTWSSTDNNIATVSSTGLATGVNSGDVQIIAASTNGKADTASLHVDEPPPDLSGPVKISEIHYDNDGGDVGEAVEIEGPAGLNLAGWSVALYNLTGGVRYATLALTGTIPLQCDSRGTLSFAAVGIQNGPQDGLALVKPDGTVVEFLSYEGVLTATDGPAAGMTSTEIDADESTPPAPGRSVMRYNDVWYGPQPSTFGSCNPAPPPPSISFTGRTVFDPPLPVGFQDQLFARLTDASGNEIVTTFTWMSETPGIASIDANGVMTALAEGTAIIRATAADGVTTATHTLPTRVPVASLTAVYAGNTEFGVPSDADPSDDFIVNRPQYTSSYSNIRNTPNWVSYNLEATHFGPEDRCDCFTFDPTLPASYTRYTTADYTGAGAFHGYGIDRGHLARSFDRTSASLDNATTFYFSNIVPQAAALNQGPWANMEMFLGDQARFSNKEVYIVTGVAGSKGTIKNEGKITIPAQTWKVAVIMPRDQGLANVDSHDDLEVIAVIMPNDPIINSDWTFYKTTVDAVEALSGYNLLALLPDPVEIAVESGTKPPNAATDGPYTSQEGAAVAMSAAASNDPDGDALTYDWDFGDGGIGTGVSASHTYSQDGSYTVRLIATDVLGLADTITTTATVLNVAPNIGAFAGATLLPGETYSASGSFTDPGADTWTGTVDYGTGSGAVALPLSGMSFTLSNTYNAAGVFTVTVGISDDDVTSTANQTVTVLTPSQGLDNSIAIVAQLLSDGKLSAGNSNSLTSKLNAAKQLLANGQTAAAASQLQSLLNELNALVNSGKLSEADAAAVRALVMRVIDSIS